ncbi:MAG TPA: Cys-tRNA(Pro) deacylase [Lachnospiraceae bacterium]|nr:Cys-tRNA(Pro) deacylase [Lachnospiraceae bacterium]
MSKKELKTNAMRILDRMKIPYEFAIYECENFTDGIETADKLALPHEQVYKTLVTTGKSRQHYIFVIPIEAEIDFKKAARAVGEKSLEMLPLKDLTNVTGYVRGGCTCIGMKKQFPTVIQRDAETLNHMYVSGGKLGMQLKLLPADLKKAAGASYADVIRNMEHDEEHTEEPKS